MIVQKLKSRKLWAAAAAFCSALAAGQPIAAAVSACVYIVAEAFIDAKAA